MKMGYLPESRDFALYAFSVLYSDHLHIRVVSLIVWCFLLGWFDLISLFSSYLFSPSWWYSRDFALRYFKFIAHSRIIIGLGRLCAQSKNVCVMKYAYIPPCFISDGGIRAGF